MNTALLPPLAKCGLDPLCLGELAFVTSKDAENIALALKQSGFDVVSLNEVFDQNDEGKEKIKSVLADSPYQFWVKYVDVFGGGINEDSGLMLFSKFPFELIPSKNYTPKPDNETSYGNDSNRVVFDKFQDCTGHDCKSDKGVLYVRLKHSGNSRLIHLFVTHLQASYSDSEKNIDADIRCKQVMAITPLDCTGPYYDVNNTPVYSWNSWNAMSKYISSLPIPETFASFSNDQWILLLGDFNIDGVGAVSDEQYPNSTDPTLIKSGPAEHQNTVGALLNAKPELPLFDAWTTTTSERDLGLTTGEERLDYIVASRRTNPIKNESLCVQHIWNPPALEALSDHRAVAADINLVAPQCSPRSALRVPDTSMGIQIGGQKTKIAENFEATIRFPGGMQWWRLDEPGTYSIAVESFGNDLKIELYEASDLSHPLAGDYLLEKTEITKCKNYGSSRQPNFDDCVISGAQSYVLPMAPIYVRAFFPDRDATGDYSIAFYRHGCSSAEDFCELLPNASYEFEFVSGQPLNADDAAWFRVRLREDFTHGEGSQNLRFVAGLSPSEASPGVEMSLTDEQGVPAAQWAPNEAYSYQWPAHPGLVAEAVDTQPTFTVTPYFSPWFLRVRRLDTKLPSIRPRVTWQSDLTLVGGSSVGATKAWLKCDDETGWGIGGEVGSDHIKLTFK
ncbi:MAG: hypothetical protein OEQ39_24850, partial [Gammaproteobacteria bacterium]|nr:hypothetical protein [Gammaproteobacteria bacterium]